MSEPLKLQPVSVLRCCAFPLLLRSPADAVDAHLHRLKRSPEPLLRS